MKKEEIINFRISKRLRERMKKSCERRGLSESDFIRLAIENEINRVIISDK